MGIWKDTGHSQGISSLSESARTAQYLLWDTVFTGVRCRPRQTKKSMGFHGHMERHRAQSRRSISQASKMHCFPWPVSKLEKNIGSAPKRRSEIWTAQGFCIAQNGPGKLEWNWTCTAQVPTLFSQSRLNLHVQLSLLLDTVFISVRCTPLQKQQLYNMQQTG